MTLEASGERAELSDAEASLAAATRANERLRDRLARTERGKDTMLDILDKLTALARRDRADVSEWDRAVLLDLDGDMQRHGRKKVRERIAEIVKAADKRASS